MTDTPVHPFSGGIPYPWARPEARDLFDTLSRDVTLPSQIQLYASMYAPGAESLNPSLAIGDLWRQALEAVSLADGLLALCRELVDDQARVAVARAARAMLDAQPEVQRRMGRMARDQRLVIDRAVFRDYLIELGAEGSTVKVLLVRGGPDTGKTWSKYLFERAADDRGADAVYLDSGIVGTVEEVVDKLFSKLNGVDRIPPADTTDVAWYRTVCNRLPALAELRQRPLWIAVDDLGPGAEGPLMDGEILRFFQQFVRHFVDPSTTRWFRLLLIHYPDEEVPTKWDQDVWKEDRTQPDAIGPTDIADVLSEWATDRHRGMAEDQIMAAAKDVIARADAVLPPADPRSRHPRLRRIHDEVRDELERLAKQPQVTP